MAEYIEREKLFEHLKKDPLFDLVERYGITGVIESIPAADVRPVVRGEWKPIDLTYGRSYYYCTACEETVDMPTAMGIPLFNYCPNCGADMRADTIQPVRYEEGE